MTGPRFASLYYTDCVPGQGLRGGAGFQFQAVSPGTSQEAMTLVQRAALYEPPVAWMRAQRPAADYPPSLAHVFDGVYVTARGVYLGVEANGVREGNQFTHAVATTDPEAYGQIRPAQLWNAPWWVAKPAATTWCDPVPGEPEIGPFGIDAVREWVLGQPDAHDWLVAVRSAFDRLADPDRRRVLFVATDPGAVLGWIAAGTVLLPQERALRVGFRVFAANPRYSGHDVLAVHPDWAGQLARPDRNDEFVVFDLTTGRHGRVEPTASALHWVSRFLCAGPDAVYDVVDAIELAEQFARNRQAGSRPSAADRVAAGVVLLGEAPDGLVAPEVLAEWLAEQPGVATEDVAEPLVAALVDGRMDVDGRRALDHAAHRHGVTGSLTGRVRLALLGAEAERLVDGGRVDVAELAAYSWTADERRAATRLIEAAADRVSPDRMDPLLCLAVDFDCAPDIARFPDGAARFVRWWVDHPDATVGVDRWSCGAALAGRLHAELVAACGGAIPDRLAADIQRHWWPVLAAHAADFAGEPDATVAAATVAAADSATRRRMIARVFGAVDDPDRAWSALFRFAPPNPAELVDLMRRYPLAAASEPIADRAFAELDRVGRLGGAELDLLRDFAAHGLHPTSRRLREAAEQDAALSGWLVEIGTSPVPDRVPGPVWRARATDVVGALVDRLAPADAVAVLGRGPAELVGLLPDGLPAIWAGQPGSSRAVRAVAVGFLVGRTVAGADGVAERVAAWVADAEPAEIRWVWQVVREVDEASGRDWRQLADQRREPAGRGKPDARRFGFRRRSREG